MIELAANLFKCLRAPDFLKIPSPYQGVDNYEVMHPSVVYFPEPEGFMGFKYWIAVTPNDAVEHENPCVYCSKDGYEWQVPLGALSADLDPKPEPEHNSDTELVFGEDKMLHCFWRWNNNAIDRIYVRSTEDGTKWSDKLIVLEAKAGLLMSPAIVRDSDGNKMWTCDSVNIYLRTSLNLTSGWSEPITCKLEGYTLGHPWHLSVFRFNEQYIALILFTTATGGENNRITVYTSKDGLKWLKGTELIEQTTTDSWDMVPYRACGVLIDDGSEKSLRMYYSGYNQAQKWHTGVTDIDLGAQPSAIA